jgi:hypothetical protein
MVETINKIMLHHGRSKNKFSLLGSSPLKEIKTYSPQRCHYDGFGSYKKYE